MTHLKKKHQQFKVPMQDRATVGRLGGGFPVPGTDWYQDLYGVGSTGIGEYANGDMDQTSSQGTDNDAGSTGDSTGAGATGGAAGPM